MYIKSQNTHMGNGGANTWCT